MQLTGEKLTEYFRGSGTLNSLLLLFSREEIDVAMREALNTGSLPLESRQIISSGLPLNNLNEKSFHNNSFALIVPAVDQSVIENAIIDKVVEQQNYENRRILNGEVLRHISRHDLNEDSTEIVQIAKDINEDVSRVRTCINRLIRKGLVDVVEVDGKHVLGLSRVGKRYTKELGLREFMKTSKKKEG